MTPQQPSMSYFIEKVLSPTSYLLTCEIRRMTCANVHPKVFFLKKTFFVFYKGGGLGKWFIKLTRS